MKANRSIQRKQKGAGIAVITLMIGAVLISSLGLFTFEMLRHNTCFDELRSACEAAALAGAAAMASSDDPNTANTRAAARTSAENAFRMNSVVGKLLNTADTSSMNAGNFQTFQPVNNGSAMFVEFIDPVTRLVVTDDNNPNGRVVRVSAAFTNEPPFGKFLGIPSVPMRTRADSSVPQLDVVMCFDTSGSIDDQTPVSFVARLQGSGKNIYTVINARPGASTPGGKANGPIYDILFPGATGSGFQAAFPQNCGTSDNPGHTRPLTFNTGMRGTASKNDALPASMAPASAPAFQYSDVVVNIDGNDVFAGTTIGPYNFPDVATLVEAARGNLENDAIATSSLAKFSVPASVTPTAGYRAAYLAAALDQTQPIGKARTAALQFFQIMNNNTDAHFGFVSFSTAMHNNPADTTSGASIDSSYTPPGNTTVRQPGVLLDQTSNQLTPILTAIPQTQADGSTNIGAALGEAVRQLKQSTGLSRSLSKKAIVFFTDGQPTIGGLWPWASDTATAQAEGIQIYTIGLAQNAAIIPAECDNLNAGAGQAITYTDPVTGTQQTYTPSQDGMAAKGASGGKFFLVTNADNLRYVFENIARNLVQLVKTQ